MHMKRAGGVGARHSGRFSDPGVCFFLGGGGDRHTDTDVLPRDLCKSGPPRNTAPFIIYTSGTTNYFGQFTSRQHLVSKRYLEQHFPKPPPLSNSRFRSH